MGNVAEATSALSQVFACGWTYIALPVSACVITTQAWVVRCASSSAFMSNGACTMTCRFRCAKFITPSSLKAALNRMNSPSPSNSRATRMKYLCCPARYDAITMAPALTPRVRLELHGTQQHQGVHHPRCEGAPQASSFKDQRVVSMHQRLHTRKTHDLQGGLPLTCPNAGRKCTLFQSAPTEGQCLQTRSRRASARTEAKQTHPGLDARPSRFGLCCSAS